MTEKENKRPRRKKTSANSEPVVQSTTQPQFVWISAHELRRVVEVIAAADGVSIQDAIDGLNEKMRRKELAIFPQIPVIQVKS